MKRPRDIHCQAQPADGRGRLFWLLAKKMWCTTVLVAPPGGGKNTNYRFSRFFVRSVPLFRSLMLTAMYTISTRNGSVNIIKSALGGSFKCYVTLWEVGGGGLVQAISVLRICTVQRYLLYEEVEKATFPEKIHVCFNTIS